MHTSRTRLTVASLLCNTLVLLHASAVRTDPSKIISPIPPFKQACVYTVQITVPFEANCSFAIDFDETKVLPCIPFITKCEFIISRQAMAIATLAACYNNKQVFRGVVKIRKGQAVTMMMDATNVQAVKAIIYQYVEEVSGMACSECVVFRCRPFLFSAHFDTPLGLSWQFQFQPLPAI